MLFLNGRSVKTSTWFEPEHFLTFTSDTLAGFGWPTSWGSQQPLALWQFSQRRPVVCTNLFSPFSKYLPTSKVDSKVAVVGSGFFFFFLILLFQRESKGLHKIHLPLHQISRECCYLFCLPKLLVLPAIKACPFKELFLY